MTILADFCKSLAPGTWGEFTSQNIDPVIGVGDDQFPILPFTGSMAWDPVGLKIKSLNASHGTGQRVRQIEYDAATNRWSIISTDAPYTVKHGFDHQTVDPLTGEHYAWTITPPNPGVVLRYRGSWQSIPMGPAFAQAIAIGTCWWSGKFDGIGAHGCWMGLNGAYGDLACYDPTTNTFPVQISGMNPGAEGRYSNVMEYSARKNCAVYGGGENTSQPDGKGYSRKLWRLDSDHSKHAMPDAPLNLAIASGMQFVDEPVSGNFLAAGFGELWELNPDGAGKWTKIGTLPPEIKIPESLYGAYATDTSGGNQTAIVSCSTYGVVIVIHAQRLRSPKVKMFVYKHAEAGVAPASDSWQRDSAGALLAMRLDTDAEILPYRGANAGSGVEQVAQVNLFVDVDGPWARIETLANAANENGKFLKYRIPTLVSGNYQPGVIEPRGMGTDPLWIRFTAKQPASRTVPPNPEYIASGIGPKCFILGNELSSTANSLGITTIYGRDYPQTYNHTNLYSNGASLAENHDGFWDMTPGWRSESGEYCKYADYRGCPKWKPDVPRTFLIRLHIRDYDKNGTNTGVGNELDVWIQDEGDKKRLLISKRDFPSGYNPQFPGGPNTVWLTTFETGRNSPGVYTYVLYRDLIVSKNEIPMPGGSPAQPPKEEAMPTKQEVETAVTALVTAANRNQDVAESAVGVINGIQARIDAAVAKAIADNPGVITPEMLAGITAETAEMGASSDRLAAAIANTPA